MDRAVNDTGTDESNNRSAGQIRNVVSTGYVLHVGGVNLVCCVTNNACNY